MEGISTRTAGQPGPDRTARIGELRFHYRETGAPQAPPVVILHGIMGVCREWDVLAAALGPHFRVIAVDQRGHGQTEWADDYTAAAMADDVAMLIETLGLSRPHVIGHSMGGMCAMLLAARRPELVGRVAILDVGPDSVSGDWARDALLPMLAAFAAASYADPEDAVEEWAAGDSLARRELLRHYVAHSLVRRGDRYVWRFDAAGLAGFVTGGVSESELWSALDRIDAPTLLVRGELSELLTRDTASAMLERLPRPSFTEVPGAGHDLGVQKPEAVAAAVLAFLRDGATS